MKAWYILFSTQILSKEIANSSFTLTKQISLQPVLDGGNEIILANWPDDKHIICNVNNDIPVEIPSHPYVLVNRSVLYNCRIEVENNFLLESLATCHNANCQLIMYFMVNTAFFNYFDSLDNLTDSLKFPLLMNRTTFEQTLYISLNLSRFDSELLTALKMLKDCSLVSP